MRVYFGSNFRPVKAFKAFYSNGPKPWSTISSASNSKPVNAKSFSSRLLGKSTGIFGYKELKEPKGIYLLEDNAVSTSQVLVNEILSPNRSRKIVQVFDELSNTICKVTDIAEFVAAEHSDKRYVSAANEVLARVRKLEACLNTNRDLYEKLKSVVEKGDVCPTDSIDDYLAELLLFHFEQFGSHLDEEGRKKVLEYNDRILHAGSQFVTRALSPRFARRTQLLRALCGRFDIDASEIIRNGFFPDNKKILLRKAIRKIILPPIKQQLEWLNELLSARQNLSQLCGFPSYAHRAIRGSIAETPEFAQEFLRLLTEKIDFKAEGEYETMEMIKRRHYSTDAFLRRHNVLAFSEVLKEKEINLQSNDYQSYFSVGACMNGLNYIFKTLYNVNISVDDVQDGELWHNDAKKLKVCEGSEILGYIYCDFFERPGKLLKSRQYVIQGARFCNNGEYQKPIVVVVLNFPSRKLSTPPLLSHTLVDNLFHEMGHAIHSMLARTKYQYVDATRCSKDLSEIPAILMERFASDSRVLTKYARHYKTGEPIPQNLVSALRSAKMKFSASATLAYIFSAAFDQACHSNECLNSSSVTLFNGVKDVYRGLPGIPDAIWHLHFEHLLDYGGKFYSYLLGQAVAAWIWQECFDPDPFDSEKGRKFRNEFLSHGGSKPPRQLVEDFLGTEITPENLSDALRDDIIRKSVAVQDYTF